ncbi:glycine cleavage system protein GcvH [Granulicoccus sp. GXG6511]|uniref:glycine cleavage system protein GcvH n=1 Tax=Granulicoccus sp. GXG6511 TaxID=3381351 RepID=UPI003D7D72A4
MAEFPEDLRYSEDHEWIRPGNELIVRVGVTDYAAEQLGDIVYVQLPEVGDSVEAGDACGELESTKSTSDLLAPVSGVITAVNQTVVDAPETINSDAYGDGWLFEIEIGSEDALDGLMDADAYAEHADS